MIATLIAHAGHSAAVHAHLELVALALVVAVLAAILARK